MKPIFDTIHAHLEAAPNTTLLCLVDSVEVASNAGRRQQFIEQMVNLVNLKPEADVVVLSADTVFRGEAVAITQENVSQFLSNSVPVLHQQASNFARCLEDTLALPLMKDKQVNVVVYFSDAGAVVPQRQEFEKFIDKGTKMIFVTTPDPVAQDSRQLDWATLHSTDEVLNDVNASARRPRM